MMKLLIFLFFVFLILKLAEAGKVADWSWWAVFSPLILVVFFTLLIGTAKAVDEAGKQ